MAGDRAERKVAELMNQAKIQLEVGQEGVEQKDEKAEKDKPKKAFVDKFVPTSGDLEVQGSTHGASYYFCARSWCGQLDEAGRQGRG